MAGSKYRWKRAIICLPAKRHLNGVSLACQWWPNIECWLGSFVFFFRRSGQELVRNPIFCDFFRGGGRDLLSSHLDPRTSSKEWKKTQQDEFGVKTSLNLNAPIVTKVVCFSRMLKCLRSLYGKQCGPRSDCSYKSSLFWVHAILSLT